MNIRVTESDYQKIRRHADFNGKSISALMLDLVWEQIEQYEDLYDIKEYEDEKINKTLVTYPWEEVKRSIDL
jgi:uncharacterized protein (DUF1778 family)